MAPFIEDGMISRPTDIAKMKESGKELFFIAVPFSIDSNIYEMVRWCSENLTDAWNFQFKDDRYIEFVADHRDAALLFKLTWHGTT